MKTATTLRRVLCATLWLWSLWLYGQTPDPIQYSPGGLLDNVYDHYGNHYTLDDIKIVKDTPPNTTGKWIDTSCDTGIFRLHYTAGSGMENPSDATHIARRAVVCKVFKDLSDFIVSPLHNAGNTQKVEIWVRDFAGMNAPTGVIGAATSFYPFPTSPNVIGGGIIDGEIWKTIHTGVDSYRNTTSPPMVAGAGSSMFYHGVVGINFSANWNLDLNNTMPTNFDLYTILLHEVMHALGIQTEIGSTGTAQLGIGGDQYFTRYDSFLRNYNATALVTTTNACPMYDNTFTAQLNDIQPNDPTWPCDPEHTQCGSVVRFNGSNITNLPIYTPECFIQGSSLSHFEDSCVAGQTNNQYFVMSNAIAPSIVKRFPKEEEKQVLCDIGYGVNSTYGSSTANNLHNYTSGSCTGITVAGVNDGIDYATSSYVYTGNINTDINLNATATSIFGNDVNATGFEGLMDVYDNTATLNGNTTPLSATTIGITAINFRTANSGLHLLRYVPINQTTNGIIRGNITYIYIYVSNNNVCTTNTCELVNNGTFESSTGNSGSIDSGTGPNAPRVSCWSIVSATPDLIDNIHPGPFGGTVAHTGNYCGGIGSTFGQPSVSLSESIQQQLSSPLIGGITYRITFWCKVGQLLNSNWLGGGVNHPVPIEIRAFNGNLISPPFANVLYVPNIIPVNNITIFPNTILTDISNHWVQFTNDFTVPNGANYNNLIIFSNYPSGTSSSSFARGYFFIDDISILSLTNNSILSLPPPICANTPIDLSIYLNPAPAGGTFSQSLNGGAFTNIVGNTFTPTTAGTYTINYTYNNNVGCPVTISDTLTVTPSTTQAPTASSQTFCSTSNPTVASLTATGTNLQWYTTATGGTALLATTPLNTGTYYVSQTVNGCESTRTPLSVTINTTIQPTASSQTFCSASNPTVASLTATGTNLQWYATATGGTPLLATTILSTGSYYVSQTVNGCESTRTPVSVTINTTTPPTASAQTFCSASNPTVASLTATGTNLQWYTTTTGGTPLLATTLLSTGTYYVSQTVNGCESTRTPLSVTINTTIQPTASSQTFCSASNPTVASLTATGTNLQWYATATGGTALPATTSLSTGTYYVLQTVNGCESTRTPVSVTITSSPTAPTASAKTFCSASNPTVASLTATGTNLQWYTTATGGNPLLATTLLSTGTYYVSQTVNGCESTRTPVSVTVNPNPTINTQPIAQTVCTGSSPSLTVVAAGTGLTYQWYSTPTNSNASGTIITGATSDTYSPTTTNIGTFYYYVVVKSNGCSVKSAVAILTVNGATITGFSPATQGICVSTNPLAISVTATGSGTIAYQWYSATTLSSATNYTGTLITNATNATYLPPTSATAITRYYYVKLTVGGCILYSSPFTVSFNAKPVINTITGTQTLCKGAIPTNLVATVTGATSYQWYVATSSSAAGTLIPGATSTTYTPPTTDPGSFYYYIVASNNGCTATSARPIVTVNGATITTTSPTTQNVCTGSVVPLEIQATGNYLSCKWYSNTTPSTTGGTLINYGTSFTLSGINYTFKYNVPVNYNEGAKYYYAVISSTYYTCPTTTSSVFTINYYYPPSVGTLLPLTQAVCPNTPTTPITVDVTTTSASPNLTYQWYSNTVDNRYTGTPIAGATASSYTPPATAVSSLYYYVVVQNNGTCATPSKTTSFVNVIGPVITNATPATQTVCPNSTTIQSLQVTATGFNLTYQWYTTGTFPTGTGSPLPGATGTSYTPTVTSAGTYYYFVKITENGNCVLKSPIYAVEIRPAISLGGNPTICLAEWNQTSLSVYPVTTGTWSSSNTAVATVNNNGFVTGITPGTVTISFASATPPSYGCPATASIVVTVLGTGSLVAVNDNFTTPINTNTGGQTPSILANDTQNGNTISPGMVNTQIMGVSSNPPQIIYPAFMLSGGVILVPPGAPVGTYTITYQIKGCSSVTATATVTFIINQVSVPSPHIVAGVRADSIVMDVDTQSTGKIIISGYFEHYNQIPCHGIAQLNNDLTLDTNFNASGASTSNFSAYDMKVIKNSGTNFNKILLGGGFSGWSGGTHGIGIARLLENGNLDTTFNTQALPLATDPNAIRGFSTKRADGSISKGMVFELFVFPDTAPVGYAGKIMVGGQFNRYNGYEVHNIVMLEPNGDFNTNTSSIAYQFNTNTNTAFGYAQETGGVGGFALQTITGGSSYILVGGSFNYLNSVNPASNYNGLVRLNLNGTLDTTFGSLPGGGLITNTNTLVTAANNGYGSCKKTIVIQPDNKIIVGGYFHKYNGNSCNNLVRLNADGTFDNLTTFNTIGTEFENSTVNPLTGMPGLVRDLYLDTAQMKLYACGDFTSYNGTACDEVIRINCAGANVGAKDPDFNMRGGGPNGTNNGPVWCMKKQEGDPKIIIGGKFTYYQDTTHPALNVTRILPAPLSDEFKTSSISYDSEPEIDIFATTEISLYPNPTTGVVYFKVDHVMSNDLFIDIYNVAGQQIDRFNFAKEELKEVQQSLDLSELATGVYFVNFNMAGKVVTKRVIVNKP